MTNNLTASEDLALQLISEWLKESFQNRTPEDYRAIAVKMPSLDALHTYVSQRWTELWDGGYFDNRLIFTIHPSDGHKYYEKYPRSISRETIRTALVRSRWREFIKDCRAAGET